MKYFCFSVLLLFFNSHTIAQTPRILSLTGYHNVSIGGIVQDDSGNLYETGSFAQTADFGGKTVTSDDTNAQSERFFIAKYSSTGSLVWLHTEVGTPDLISGSVVTDAGNSIVLYHGNLYIAAIFQSSQFKLDGITAHNSTTTFTSSILLLKYSLAGQLLWAHPYGDSGNDVLNSLSIGPDGNLYAAGYSSSSHLSMWGIPLTGSGTGEEAPLIASFDTNSNARWAKLFPARVVNAPFPTTGGNDEFQDLAIDSLGDLYAVGYVSSDTIPIGDSIILNTGSDHYRAILVKFHNNGDVASLRVSDPVSQFQFAHVAVDHSNDPIFCVSFIGNSIDLAGHPFTNADNASSVASALFKCNPSGTLLWSQTLSPEGDNPDSTGGMIVLLVRSLPNNDIGISGLGYSAHALLYSGSPLPFPANTANLFLMDLASDGTLNWNVNGTFLGEGSGTALVPARDGSLYFAGLYGTFGRALHFGTDSLPYLNTIASFVMHLTDQPLRVLATTQPLEPSIAFPDPSNGQITISLPPIAIDNNISIRVYDELGREHELLSSISGADLSLSCKNLETGRYVYHIMHGNTVITEGTFVIR